MHRLIALTTATLVAATGLGAPAAAAAPTATATYIVQFTPGTNAAAQATDARTKGFAVSRIYTNVFPGMVVTATDAQRNALAKNPNVKLIEADGAVRASDTQSSAPWGLDRLDQRALPLSGDFVYDRTASGVKTYIVDTGVLATHTDFGGRVSGGYTAIADGRGTTDCNGHGTHVAGTVAGSVYGVAKAASIVPVRVLDCAGSGSWSGVIAGLDWIGGQHVAGTAAVANMSLGGGANSSVDTAVNNLIKKGVTVVVAAGNDNRDACTFSPARVAAAITVAATDRTDTRASFSNFGKCVDVFAPGVGITSAWHTSTTSTATISGTSMAAPHVAGLVAANLALTPTVSPSQIESQIVTEATKDVVRSAGTGSPNRLGYLTPTPVTPPVTETPVVEQPVNEQPQATAPAAPTNVVAKGARGSASVSWAQGADGGSALTSQTVTVYRSGKVTGTVTVSGTATSVTIRLSKGSGYSFTVTATNAVGSSPASAMSNTVNVT
jgi:subtilisin family serine protease